MTPLDPLRPAGRHVSIWVGAIMVVSALCLEPEVYAQREPGAVTLGMQVGWSSGLTVKLYQNDHIAYDALLTADGDDFARLSLFRIWERSLPKSSVHVYYGPGAAVGGRNLDTRVLPEVSVSGKLGVNFYAERFEVFLHATPTLRLGPPPRPRLWGGVGLRYNLGRP